MIDTNVAIHLRDNNPEILERLSTLSERPLLSIVTRVELEGGIARNPDFAGNRRAALDAMLHTLKCLPFEDSDAARYGSIVETVGYTRGRTLDRMIAAQAIGAGATLITINGRDFQNIPGLDLEVWPEPSP